MTDIDSGHRDWAAGGPQHRANEIVKILEDWRKTFVEGDADEVASVIRAICGTALETLEEDFDADDDCYHFDEWDIGKARLCALMLDQLWEQILEDQAEIELWKEEAKASRTPPAPPRPRKQKRRRH